MNPVAIAALVLGVLPNIPGFLGAIGVWQPPAFFSSIYAYTWFIGFALAAFVYTAGMYLFATETQAWTATSRS